jgi:hypothetical protein
MYLKKYNIRDKDTINEINKKVSIYIKNLYSNNKLDLNTIKEIEKDYEKISKNFVYGNIGSDMGNINRHNTNETYEPLFQKEMEEVFKNGEFDNNEFDRKFKELTLNNNIDIGQSPISLNMKEKYSFFNSHKTIQHNGKIHIEPCQSHIKIPTETNSYKECEKITNPKQLETFFEERNDKINKELTKTYKNIIDAVFWDLPINEILTSLTNDLSLT